MIFPFWKGQIYRFDRQKTILGFSQKKGIIFTTTRRYTEVKRLIKLPLTLNDVKFI